MSYLSLNLIGLKQYVVCWLWDPGKQSRQRLWTWSSQDNSVPGWVCKEYDHVAAPTRIPPSLTQTHIGAHAHVHAHAYALARACARTHAHTRTYTGTCVKTCTSHAHAHARAHKHKHKHKNKHTFVLLLRRLAFCQWCMLWRKSLMPCLQTPMVGGPHAPRH